MKRRVIGVFLALLVAAAATVPALAMSFGQAKESHPPTLHVKCDLPFGGKSDVGSGNATWSWKEPDEKDPGKTYDVAVAVDALPPLYGWVQKTDPVTVPKWITAAVPYTFSWDITPDRVTIAEYDIKDDGKYWADPLSTQELKKPFKVSLKKDRVYSVWAHWSDTKYETNQCCGSAEFVFYTK